MAMTMKMNGFTFIEFLILLLILLQAFAIYVRVTTPEWSVNFDNSYPYFGVSGFTVLFGLMAMKWLKKKQYGYISIAFIFVSIGWLFKLFGQPT
jgi:hypothetical protein